MRWEKRKYEIYRNRKVFSLFGFIIVNGETNDFIWTGKFFKFVSILEQKNRVRYSEFDDGWTYREYWGKWRTEWVFKKIIMSKIYSPITGKEMVLKKSLETISYKGFDIVYEHNYYYCEDSKESFTTTELDTINMNNIEKKYLKK